MPLQSLMIMLILTIILPLMILTSNNEVFFIIISIVLLFSSMHCLSELFFTDNNQTSLDDEDADPEDLQEFLGLDIGKLEAGFHFVKDFIILLYLTYCTFYVHNALIKFFILAIALHWVCDIILSMQNMKFNFCKFQFLSNIWTVIVNIGTIYIIVITAFSKYMFNI